jgi:MSHA biogenesis protein MshQ
MNGHADGRGRHGDAQRVARARCRDRAHGGTPVTARLRILALGLLLCSLPPAARAFKMEAASIDLPATANNQTTFVAVPFQQTYDVVPVVVVLTTSQGSAPAAIRIRNVTLTGFEMAQVEPPPEDGQHGAMTVHYLAAEPGAHLLPDGARLEVGTLSTNQVQHGSGVGGPEGSDPVSFASGFSAAPVLLADIQTMVNESASDPPPGGSSEPWLTTAVMSLTSAGASLALERSQVDNPGPMTPASPNETIGWIAIDRNVSGTFTDSLGGTIGYQTIATGAIFDGWDDGCDNLAFGTTYNPTPLLIATKSTHNHDDGGWLRRCSLSQTGFGLTVDEDRDQDSERSHPGEAASVVVFSQAFVFDSNFVPPGGGTEWRLEAASATLSPNAFTDITFRQTYAQPPAVFLLENDTNPDPSEARIVSISATGFRVVPVEPPFGAPGASDTLPDQPTTIHYLAADKGVYEFPDGTKIEIGEIAVQQIQENFIGGPPSGWDTLSFNTIFAAAPALLLEIQTMANEPGHVPGAASVPWLATAVESGSVTVSGARIALERAEVDDGNVAVAETVAYLAVDRGIITAFTDNAGVSIKSEAQVTASAINGWATCGSFNFLRVDYPAPPLVIGSLMSHAGNDGGWLRRCNISPTAVQLVVDEDQDRDIERNHANGENAGLMVFSQAFDVDFALKPVISTTGTATLAGVNIADEDLVRYEPATDTASIIFDGSTLFSSDEDVDAAHILPNGHLILSTNGNATLGGLSFEDGDLVDYDPVTDTAVLFFDEDLFSGDEEVDAVYVRANGNIVLSTDSNATLGGLSFSDGDLVEYNPGTNTATLLFSENLFTSGNEDIDAVHILDDGDIVLSTDSNATLGGLSFGPDDLVRYDPGSDAAVLVFEGDLRFSNTSEVIDAVTFGLLAQGAVVDHYAIAHSGLGVTCEAEPVSITAHDASHNPVAPGTSTTITVSTAPAADAWALASGTGLFLNLGGGVAEYTFGPGETSVGLWLTRTSATLTMNIGVLDTGGKSEQEDPSIEFRDTALRFYSDGVANMIGTQIAGKPSNVAPGVAALTLRAVQTNSDTGACEARLTGAQQIGVYFQCVDPPACLSGLTFAGVPIGSNPGAPTAVDLTFDGTGRAPFDFSYADAGQITLHAIKDLAASPPDPAITLTGASNAFVVRPFGLDLDFGDDRANNGTAGASYAADADGSVFVHAGENFVTTVTAVVWQAGDDVDQDGVPDAGDVLGDNAATPNFGQETATPVVTVSHTLVLPSPGNAGGLAGGSFASWSAGARSQALTWSEVGIIDLSGILQSGSYLGTGNLTGEVRNVGRFYPADFDVAANTPMFETACADFTYIGQPFEYANPPQLTATARNLAGATTLNYTGDFFKLTNASLANKIYDDTSGTLNTSSVPAPDPVIVDVGNGTATLTFSDGGGFTFDRAVPVAPFDAEIELTIEVIDEDGVAYASNPARFGDISTPGGGIDFDGPKEMRWGRLVLSNAFGSELLPLVLPLRAEYFRGGGFAVNLEDDGACTGYDATSLMYSAQDPPGFTVTGSGAGTLVSGRHDPSNPMLLSSMAAVPGSATAELPVPTWLQYDWRAPFDGLHTENPTASITFGIFSGRKAFIYQREPWE